MRSTKVENDLVAFDPLHHPGVRIVFRAIAIMSNAIAGLAERRAPVADDIVQLLIARVIPHQQDAVILHFKIPVIQEHRHHLQPL